MLMRYFFDLVRQINKRIPVNKDRKTKGKNSGQTNSSVSSGKPGADGLQTNSATNGNQQGCCLLL